MHIEPSELYCYIRGAALAACLLDEPFLDFMIGALDIKLTKASFKSLSIPDKVALVARQAEHR